MLAKHKLSTYIATISCLASNVCAFEIGPPLTIMLPIHNAQEHILSSPASQEYKEIKLMNFILSPSERQTFIAKNYQYKSQAPSKTSILLPKQAMLYLPNIPVLDQGPYGSCVTFANTVAIDALLNKGNYISQLCLLSLSSYLSSYGYWPNAWEGSTGPIVLEQILEFGVVSNDWQMQKICANIAAYPNTRIDNISKQHTQLAEYRRYSDNVNNKIAWKSLLDLNKRTTWDFLDLKASILLETIKTIIASSAKEHRSQISIGALLPVAHCKIGACASYHSPADTWVISKDIKQDINPQLGGHEMIIIGYDDNAVAQAIDGSKHKGLLILRNSWGANAGDHGHYYMSYDFFKTFVFEVQHIFLSRY